MTETVCSARICRCHWFNNDFVYSPRIVLLEGVCCGSVIGMETEIAQLSSNDANKRRLNRLALALMIYGIGIMVFCLSFNIYKIMHHTEPAH